MEEFNFVTSALIKVTIDGDPARVILFNPKDALLRGRIMQFAVDFKKRMKDAQAEAEKLSMVVEKDEDGFPLNAQAIIDFNNAFAQDFIKELDDIFGAGSGEKLFGKNAFDQEVLVNFLTFTLNRIDKVSKIALEKKLGGDLKPVRKKAAAK
jgi:hypothetical protein